MDATTIKVSELFGPHRIDAECYRTEFLRLDFEKGFHPLKDLCLIQSGTTPPDRDNNLRQGIVLLKTTDIRNNVLSKWDSDDFYYITPKIANRMKATALQPEDVLINIVGATTDVIGRVSYVPKSFPGANITQAMAFLRVTDKRLNPAFLFSYLSGKYGNKQVRRYARPTGQFNLNLQELGRFQIPLPAANFQIEIEKLIKTARDKQEESKKLYVEAQSLLAAELGLDKLDLSESLYSVRRVSDVAESGRADAEYFQPKYQRMIATLSRSRKCIEDVAELATRRFKPEPGKSFNYIEISDLVGDGQLESAPLMGEDAPSRAQWIVHAGDVITSTVRPIRRLSALVESEQDGFVCSSGFVVLKSKEVEPELLLLYLRLPIVCEILDLYTTASMYPAISTSDLLNIPITLPENKSLQRELVNQVKGSRQARRDAQRLLGEAKTEVERLIEQA